MHLEGSVFGLLQVLQYIAFVCSDDGDVLQRFGSVWCLVLLWRVQSHQHRGAVSHRSTAHYYQKCQGSQGNARTHSYTVCMYNLNCDQLYRNYVQLHVSRLCLCSAATSVHVWGERDKIGDDLCCFHHYEPRLRWQNWTPWQPESPFPTHSHDGAQLHSYRWGVWLNILVWSQ